jgi:hypothetical protein
MSGQVVSQAVFDASSAFPRAPVDSKFYTSGAVAAIPAPLVVFDHRGLPASSVWKWTYRERTVAGAAAASAWGVFTLDAAGTLAAGSLAAVPTAVQQALNGVTIGYVGGIQITGAGANNLWTCEVAPYA